MWHHGTLTAAIDWNLIQKILLSVEHPSTNGSLVVWAPVVWDSNRGTPKNPRLPFMFGIQTTGPQTTNVTLAEAYKKELFTIAPRIAWFLMIFGAPGCLGFLNLFNKLPSSHFIQTRLGSNSPNDNKKYTMFKKMPPFTPPQTKRWHISYNWLSYNIWAGVVEKNLEGGSTMKRRGLAKMLDFFA